MISHKLKELHLKSSPTVWKAWMLPQPDGPVYLAMGDDKFFLADVTSRAVLCNVFPQNSFGYKGSYFKFTGDGSQIGFVLGGAVGQSAV